MARIVVMIMMIIFVAHSHTWIFAQARYDGQHTTQVMVNIGDWNRAQSFQNHSRHQLSENIEEKTAFLVFHPLYV